MRTLLILLLSGLGASHARPIQQPTTAELQSAADCVVVMRPVSVRMTKDKPDDTSFGDRDISNYQPLETTCRVECVFKGGDLVKEDTVKIVHFAYASPKPEFNGGALMTFLFAPSVLVSFPGSASNFKPDLGLMIPYAFDTPQYLAFLRRLPDGRFAAAVPHYDAAAAFRVLTTPMAAQRYHLHPAAQPGQEAGK